MNENDLIDRQNEEFYTYHDAWVDQYGVGNDEQRHVYGTIEDFCGLMDTYDAALVWDLMPKEYAERLFHAIDQSRFQSP